MKFAILYRIDDLALIEMIRRRVTREIGRMKGLYKNKQQTYNVNTNNFAGLFDKMRTSFDKTPTYVTASGSGKQI